MCKALHEKILHILISGGLLKEAYIVVKVIDTLLCMFIDFLICMTDYYVDYFLFRTMQSRSLCLL